MAKTRLRNQDRERLLTWMTRGKPEDEAHEKLIDGKLKVLVEHINPLLEKKYPKTDMAVLFKYDLTRKDCCLKFQILDTGQVYLVELNPYKDILTNSQLKYVKENIASIPSRGGCRNNTIYEGTTVVRDLFAEMETLIEDYKEDIQCKRRKYNTFLHQCKTLEDVQSVVEIPVDILETIIKKGSALVFMNPDVLEDIRKEFRK